MNLSPERRAALDAALAADPDWQAFLRHFDLSHDFSFVVLLIDSRENAEICREALAAHLAAKGGASGIELIAPASTDEFRELPNRLYYPKVESGTQAIWIEKVVTEGDPAFEEWRQTWRFTFARLNSLRNIMQRTIPCAVVFAGAPWIQVAIRETAPDLWSVRSAVTRVSLAVRSRSDAILEQVVGEGRPSPTDGPDPEFALEMAKQLRGKSGQERELAFLLQRAGEGFLARGEHRQAINVLEEAIDLESPISFEKKSHRLLLLGRALRKDAKWAQAETCFREALAVNQLGLGDRDTATAISKSELASVLVDTNQLKEAELLFRQALNALESNLGDGHPNVASTLNNLANLLMLTGRTEEAEELYRRSLLIEQKVYGPDDPSVARSMGNLASALKSVGRLDEAELFFRRALSIDEQSGRASDIASDLNNLGGLFIDSKRMVEAESSFRRALALQEGVFGPEHPRVATSLNNLGVLLESLNRVEEAQGLYRRALEIDERSYGSNHPDVARDLNNLAGSIHPADTRLDVSPLYSRALEILQSYQERTGFKHPNIEQVKRNYQQYLEWRARHSSAGMGS